MFFLLKFAFTIAAILVVVGFARTWQVQHQENQDRFVAAAVPSPLPDGLYHGTVPGHTVSWQGKKFKAADHTGINVFADGERYPFTTSVGKGLLDTNLDVLKIEYNTAGNPFWLRPILDEIVQVASGQYLGKMHVRLIPGHPFTVGYFELKR